MQDKIFITGATGNIGLEIVRYLLTNSATQLTLLVRADTSIDGLNRMQKSLYTIDPAFELEEYRDRITFINGDITNTNLGLNSDTYSDLAQRTTHIIHCAASTKFNQPLDAARKVNLIGTHNVMRFADTAWRAGSLRRIAAMSTAFVCGNISGFIPENFNSVKPPFSNSYEQTKWEAERLILNDFSHLPIDILRPSIVIGNSQNGRIREINVLYIPLKLILQGLVKVLPANPENRLDIVPVDYVARVTTDILLKMERPKGIGIYHICAGKNNSPAIDEIVSLTLQHLSCGTQKPPEYITDYEQCKSSSNINKNPDRVEALIQCYKSYLKHRRDFGITNLQLALKGSGIELPEFLDYFKRSLDYAMRTKWGRNTKPAA